MRDGDVYRIRASYGYAREAVDYALTKDTPNNSCYDFAVCRGLIV